MHGLVTLDYGDGSYPFRLALSGIEELEERLDRSIFEIAEGLGGTGARSAWIREVLRVGLVGGGMAPADALAKVRRYTDERPLVESRTVAYMVTVAGLARVHSDTLEREASAPPKKRRAPRKSRKGSTSAASAAPPS